MTIYTTLTAGVSERLRICVFPPSHTETRLCRALPPSTRPPSDMEPELVVVAPMRCTSLFAGHRNIGFASGGPLGAFAAFPTLVLVRRSVFRLLATAIGTFDATQAVSVSQSQIAPSCVQKQSHPNTPTKSLIVCQKMSGLKEDTSQRAGGASLMYLCL